MDAEAPLATYTLQLMGPDTNRLSPYELQARWLLPRFVTETEENLTNLLPEGYSVRIKEWDDEHD